MAPSKTLTKKATVEVTIPASSSPYQVDTVQTLKASTALLKKINADVATKSSSLEKANLLADADDGEEVDEDVPVWLVLTTKKHIVDKKRLKPGKIVLPNPLRSVDEDGLRICLITADPQRKYKDLVAEPSFPLDVGKRVARVLGMEKLKSKYKSYESKRQLLSEYDIFLADDRIITYLPNVLGKVFYKGGSKRPIPVSLEGKKQNVLENGEKRKKLAEGGSKVEKKDVRPEDVAHEITKALGSALVHLAPSTTTAVKVGKASMSPEQVQANIEAVVAGMVEKYVPQQWRNVRAVHVKGPETAALPIWLTDELWADEADVLEEAPSKENPGKKRKRSALTDANGNEYVEVPGPDGKMRKIEKKRKSTEAEVEEQPALPKKTKIQSPEELEAKENDKAEKAARKEALKKQKDAAAEKIKSGGDSKRSKKGKSKA
ncbi:Putative ribosomal protein L1 [Septoria linicola]|uniref:Ribosomal protein L1 n=1 Tax=Septoria linicola TaxID=215465 RepID=A0A9Q9AS64_9PEZI|nr:putative ribosomal protein L1 [Septoria linicola]USW49766.1 Putative ribosomal protein L1 [Septoria linicola]